MTKNFKKYLILIIPILILSCSKRIFNQVGAKSNTQKKENNLQLKCIVTGIDLTEDVSAVSTQNDELLFFVYADSTGQIVPDIILQKYFVIDKWNLEKIIELNSIHSNTSSLTFVLIEQDTEKNLSQIEPVVRLNIEKLIKAEAERDIRTINRLLGDDDLIGIKKLQSRHFKKRKKVVKFRGIHLFDSFEYKIEIN